MLEMLKNKIGTIYLLLLLFVSLHNPKCWKIEVIQMQIRHVMLQKFGITHNGQLRLL